jgi:hypothetical protein
MLLLACPCPAAAAWPAAVEGTGEHDAGDLAIRYNCTIII